MYHEIIRKLQRSLHNLLEVSDGMNLAGVNFVHNDIENALTLVLFYLQPSYEHWFLFNYNNI